MTLSDPDNPTAGWVMATVICDREDCPNQGIKMNLLVDPDTETQNIICGPCGLPMSRVIIPAIEADPPKVDLPEPSEPEDDDSGQDLRPTGLVNAAGEPLTVADVADGSVPVPAEDSGTDEPADPSASDNADLAFGVPQTGDVELVGEDPTPAPSDDVSSTS